MSSRLLGLLGVVPPLMLSTAVSAQGPFLEEIAPTTAMGRTDAYILRNAAVEAVVLPAVGRIASFRFTGEPNIYRFDEALASSADESVPAGEWRNYGGDWIWIAAQNRWAEHFGAGWPPPPGLDDGPWKARAGRAADGSQIIHMERELPPPFSVLVHRTIILKPDAAVLEIRQRIQAQAPSRFPLTIWHISQIAGAQRAAFPVRPDSRFPEGFVVLDFEPPRPEWLARTGNILVVDTARALEVKLGSDAPDGWIAAQKGDVLILARAKGRGGADRFPDGGCRVELYANKGLGYAEIETLSEETELEAGGAIENLLILSLHRIPPDLTDEEFARRLEALVGDAD